MGIHGTKNETKVRQGQQDILLENGGGKEHVDTMQDEKINSQHGEEDVTIKTAVSTTPPPVVSDHHDVTIDEDVVVDTTTTTTTTTTPPPIVRSVDHNNMQNNQNNQKEEEEKAIEDVDMIQDEKINSQLGEKGVTTETAAFTTPSVVSDHHDVTTDEDVA